MHPDFPYLNNFKLNKEDLYEVLNECRVHKDETEKMLMRHINRLSSEAHIRVMRSCRPGLKEY